MLALAVLAGFPFNGQKHTPTSKVAPSNRFASPHPQEKLRTFEGRNSDGRLRTEDPNDYGGSQKAVNGNKPR